MAVANLITPASRAKQGERKGASDVALGRRVTVSATTGAAGSATASSSAIAVALSEDDPSVMAIASALKDINQQHGESLKALVGEFRGALLLLADRLGGQDSAADLAEEGRRETE